MKARRKSIVQQGRMLVRSKLKELDAEINNERQLKSRLKLSLKHADSERDRLEGKVRRLQGHYQQLEEAYLNMLEDYMHMERAYEAQKTQSDDLRESVRTLWQERRAVQYLLTKTRTNLLNVSILAGATGVLALAYFGLYIGAV